MISKSKTSLNLYINLFSKLIVVILGFFVPRIVLGNYGSDTNGLISTVTQIFSYVALLEAGISQATINALYEPIKDNNKDKICSVLVASRSYFRKMTVYYALIVICLAVSLPFVISTNISKQYVFLIVLLEGSSGVISFWFVQTSSVFLVADGQTALKAIIELIIRVLSYGIKIILAVNSVNIIYVELGYFVLSLLNVVLYKFIFSRKYPWISYLNPPQKIILKDRKAFVVNELAWTVFSATDAIVLSVFCSTVMASVYSINNMVIISINGFLTAAYNGVYYLLGQKYYSDIEKYKYTHDVFNSVFIGAICITMSATVVLMHSFIDFYANSVSDVEYYYRFLCPLLATVQILSWSRYVSGNLTGLAGYAQNVSRLSVVEATVNIVLSIVLVLKFGMYGVVFATVIALPIKVIYAIYISDIVILHRSAWKTVLIVLSNFMAFFIVVCLQMKIDFYVYRISDFIVAGIMLIIILSIVIYGINVIVNDSFRSLIHSKIKSLISRKKPI